MIALIELAEILKGSFAGMLVNREATSTFVFKYLEISWLISVIGLKLFLIMNSFLIIGSMIEILLW